MWRYLLVTSRMKLPYKRRGKGREKGEGERVGERKTHTPIYANAQLDQFFAYFKLKIKMGGVKMKILHILTCTQYCGGKGGEERKGKEKKKVFALREVIVVANAIIFEVQVKYAPH